MKSTIHFLMIMAFIIGSTSPIYSQNTEQLYQKGLMKEEGEGALSEAITIYNQILENKDATKSLQAKALLHIGMCYEKMGRQEATKAYQRLVNNFPGQEKEVAIARERLSKLIQIAEKISKTLLTPKFRKLIIPTRLSWTIKLSPDGKKIIFPSTSDKKLWIMPLFGNLGSEIPGIPQKLNTDSTRVDWSGLAMSADGKWIAFNERWEEKNPIKVNQGICVVSADGGKPKRVIENFRDARIVNYKISLSPDGKTLAYSSVENEECHIYTISVDGGLPKQLVDAQAREPVFSPNGKMIAFVDTKNLGRAGGGLWVIPATNGTPKLVVNAGNASSPTWAPEGDMIAFLDGEQVCIIPVAKDGTANGELIKIDVPEETGGINSLAGWTPDNKIGIVFRSKTEFGLYTVPATGGTSALISHGGYPTQPRWSPDGENIFHTNNIDEGSGDWERYSLAVVPTEGGKVKTIPIQFDDKMVKPSYGGGNNVSPDGKMIVFSGQSKIDTTWHSQIWTLAIDGGIPKQITETPESIFNGIPCWSPDGKFIAYIRANADSINYKGFTEVNICMISANGGNPKVLTSDTDSVKFCPIAWSPDGKLIAYFSKDTTNRNAGILKILSLNDGVSRVLAKFKMAHIHKEIAWSPDSKRIALNYGSGTYSKVIRIISIDDGSFEDIKTGLKDVKMYHLDWSPDGERFAFSGFIGDRPELWLLENFLPLDKLAQKENPKPAKIPEGIRIEQVWSGPEVDNSGSVSPDGEYLSFVDWDTGDLALRNLNTKQNKRLIAGSWDTPMQYAQYNVISPNGKKIAYSWWNNNASDLFLINIDNPSPQLLYRKKGTEVYPVSWLSDKEIIVTIKKKGADSQIGSYSILDGTMNLLKTFEQRKWPQLSSAPDEKHIAYDFANESHNGNFDINILSMENGKKTSLVTHSANDRVLGWVPGSNEFMFISDRSGTWDLWTLTVDEGKPSGEVKKIYTDIGEVQSMGFTQSGDCYFGFSRRSFNTYLAPLKAEKKQLSVKKGKSLLGSNLWVKWSHDAQYLCYIKEDRNSKNLWQLTIQNLKTGVERKLAHNLLMAMSPCWSPDGHSILVVGIDKNEYRTKGYKGGIYIVDVTTGQTKEILLLSNYKYNTPDDDAFPLSDLQWSKDGKNIYYLFFKDRLVKHNLETGEENILYTHSHFNSDVLSNSPDGKSLLLATRSSEETKSRLFTISSEGGEETELCTSQQAKAFEKAIWSPDGKYIYFTERKEGTTLWRISVEGGNPQKMWTSKDRVEVFSIHPDGKQIALAIRERTTEIRVIKGLVQELEKLKVED